MWIKICSWNIARYLVHTSTERNCTYNCFFFTHGRTLYLSPLRPPPHWKRLSNIYFIYRPFHKTLPRSSEPVNWISLRFYETDCISNSVDHKIILLYFSVKNIFLFISVFFFCFQSRLIFPLLPWCILFTSLEFNELQGRPSLQHSQNNTKIKI